jgi:hypothetical protein
MPSPEYYRRQSELCLQLALLHNDTRTTYWLVELAREMQIRAGEVEGDTERSHSEMPPYLMDSEKLQNDGEVDHD